MIYNAMGNGSFIQRNKERISYVKDLTYEFILGAVEELFISLENKDISGLEENIEGLFYEKVEVHKLESLIKLHSEMGTEKRLEVKMQMIKECLEKPEKGFIWNCYMVCAAI